jgi:hypothetical protein
MSKNHLSVTLLAATLPMGVVAPAARAEQGSTPAHSARPLSCSSRYRLEGLQFARQRWPRSVNRRCLWLDQILANSLAAYPVSRLMVRMPSPCRFKSSISCTSLPHNASRLLLPSRVGAGFKTSVGGRFFERHYQDYTTGADKKVRLEAVYTFCRGKNSD